MIDVIANSISSFFSGSNIVGKFTQSVKRIVQEVKEVADDVQEVKEVSNEVFVVTEEGQVVRTRCLRWLPRSHSSQLLLGACCSQGHLQTSITRLPRS